MNQNLQSCPSKSIGHDHPKAKVPPPSNKQCLKRLHTPRTSVSFHRVTNLKNKDCIGPGLIKKMWNKAKLGLAVVEMWLKIFDNSLLHLKTKLTWLQDIENVWNCHPLQTQKAFSTQCQSVSESAVKSAALIVATQDWTMSHKLVYHYSVLCVQTNPSLNGSSQFGLNLNERESCNKKQIKLMAC